MKLSKNKKTSILIFELLLSLLLISIFFYYFNFYEVKNFNQDENLLIESYLYSITKDDNLREKFLNLNSSNKKEVEDFFDERFFDYSLLVQNKNFDENTYIKKCLKDTLDYKNIYITFSYILDESNITNSKMIKFGVCN